MWVVGNINNYVVNPDVIVVGDIVVGPYEVLVSNIDGDPNFVVLGKIVVDLM